MISLTSDVNFIDTKKRQENKFKIKNLIQFDSDSFTSEISKTTSKRTETMIENSNKVDHLKNVIDLQGEKLNQMTNNNREVCFSFIY